VGTCFGPVHWFNLSVGSWTGLSLSFRLSFDEEEKKGHGVCGLLEWTVGEPF